MGITQKKSDAGVHAYMYSMHILTSGRGERSDSSGSSGTRGFGLGSVASVCEKKQCNNKSGE